MSDEYKMDFSATSYYRYILDENGEIVDDITGGYVERLVDAERVIREMHEVWTSYRDDAPRS